MAAAAAAPSAPSPAATEAPFISDTLPFSATSATLPPPVAPLSDAETRLAAAAASVAEALARLATVEQSAHRVHVQALTPAALPPELQVRVNVEYQGDLKPLVHELARTVGY